MKIMPTKFYGVYCIEPKDFQDERGAFVKVFHRETWLAQQLKFELAESYYSISKKNVIRGMHFQAPPTDHTKLVYVTYGRIMDVILDIRAGSPTYGQSISLELSRDNHKIMYIAPGFAHGFLSLVDDSAITYLQTTMHSPEHDQGIHVSSFEMDWGVANPIMSKRDQGFPGLDTFKTPFTYQPYETVR